MDTYTFIFSSIIIILLPGTGVMFTVSTGIQYGKKTSIVAAFACTLGILPHLAVSILFSSFIKNLNQNLFFILQCIGAAYLIYLGIGMIIQKEVSFEKVESQKNPLNIIKRGLCINLLNPKLSLFFLSFLPQYIKTSGNEYLLQCFVFGLLFMLLTLIVFILYGLLASSVRALLVDSPKKIKRIQTIFGILFICFAIRLLIK